MVDGEEGAGEDATVGYIITVWVVTFTATASVLSGLGRGIRILSLTGFGIAFSLWFAFIFWLFVRIFFFIPPPPPQVYGFFDGRYSFSS